jgi:hypothetical protein
MSLAHLGVCWQAAEGVWRGFVCSGLLLQLGATTGVL